MEITLPSGRKIGDGHAPFIICEVGSNWQTLDDCLHSIAMAKACGADAVKFQAYTRQALYGFTRSEFEMPMQGVLPLDWLPLLKAKADACGIEFMCSAFSPELVDAVDPFVNIHKVASAELTHVRMLERLAGKGKPVILSTGASGIEDIRIALNFLTSDNSRKVPVVLLYCVAAYPANEVNLDCIPALRERFGTLVGYSDHTTDVLSIPSGGVSRGACVLEKHFNALDTDTVTPDSGHSLDVRSFKLMVSAIRGEVRADLGVAPEETPMILRHNRRLIATRDIKPGEALREGENFGIYRSLKDDVKALSPWAIGQVNGRVAKGAIRAGDGIGPGDIE